MSHFETAPAQNIPEGHARIGMSADPMAEKKPGGDVFTPGSGSVLSAGYSFAVPVIQHL